MTIDRAIEILDPEHREHYDGMDEVNEACRMGMEALERGRNAAPVVRCRDCIHRQGDDNPMCMLHTEPYPNVRGYKGEAVCVEMNGFCSCGERIAGNDT